MGMTTKPFFDPLLAGVPEETAQQTAARILAGPHLSILTTINPDGSPQASVIFVKYEDGDLLFSTIKGRRKTRNMEREPRVSLLVHGLPVGSADGTYAVISGIAKITDDPENTFHQVMFDLHMGGATAPPEPGAERVVVRLHPTHTYAPPPYDETAE